MNYEIKITGTLIKNFFHCKRQAYLYYYGLNFRNDIVRIGEIMHEEQKTKEFVFEKIKIDDIKDHTLIEFKKTSSNLKGTTFQVLYYLKYFKEKGLNFKGLIKDLTFKDEIKVELNEENERKLEKVLQEIKENINGNLPSKQKLKKNCKNCSFFDYCWIE